MRYSHFVFVLGVAVIATGSVAFSAQKAKNNNNSAQERKDDANVQNKRQDVSTAEKKMQADVKEIREAEVEAKKSLDAIATAKKSMDETSGRLERWISQNLGIPEAIEAQRAALAAYDETSKPLLAAMKTNPKYMPSIERAEKANGLLKSLATDTQMDEATRKQQQSQAAKDMSDWRNTMSSYLESLPELKYPHEKLVTAQKKLAEIRSQMKKQLEVHPDLKAAEKKWTQAKEAHEKDKQKIAILKGKAASDQNKLVAERAQLAKAAMQDKQNNNKNNKNNNNNKNKNKNKKKN